MSSAFGENRFLIGRHQGADTLKPCLEIIKIAYAQLSIPFMVVDYPGRRSIFLANEGKLDAELCRIEEIEADVPNLIRMTPVLANVKLHAISRYNVKDINTIDGLAPYRIVSIRGMKAAEVNFSEKEILYVTSPQDALSLVQHHRADVALLPDSYVKDIPAELKFHPHVLFNYPLFHYIHVKHSADKARIEQALKTALLQLSTEKRAVD